MKNKNILTLVTFISISILSCIELPTKPGGPFNPFDPDNPNYIEPTVDLTSGPQEGAILTTDVVTFQWQGNNENMQFRYSFDDLVWSAYADIAQVTFSNMDEFGHQFQLQGRYPSLAEGLVISRSFTVDAIQGPALYVFPKHKSITAGEQFQMELWLDETTNIAGLSTQLIFAPAKLRIDAVDFLEAGQESVLLQNGGQLVTFSEINNTTGTLQLDCAVVESVPHDVSGSGVIVRITFTHLSGTDAALTLASSSSLQNSDGQTVVLNNLVGSQIDVQ